MRKFNLAIVTLLVCLIAAPAFAWEFGMTGAFITEYRYATQLGTNGFFGPYDLIGPTNNGGAALANVVTSETLNFWHGIHFRGISGMDWVGASDAATHAIWMDIEPSIRINKAVRIRGRYRVGNHDLTSPAVGADDFDPQYYNSTQSGPWRSFASGQWMMLWATAQTPWGILAIGKRPFAFGTGLMFDGTINASTESVLFVAPYGPFRFLLAFYPARSTGASVNRANKSFVEDWEWAWVMTYSCGPLQIGTFWDYLSASTGPEGGTLYRSYNTTLAQFLWLRKDSKNLFTTHYIKYANGRFLLNAEFGTFNTVNRYDGFGISTVNDLGRRSDYRDSYRWLVEAGVLAGPVKLRGIYISATGGLTTDNLTDESMGLSNTVCFKDYTLLMGRNYGFGTQFSSTAYEGVLDNAWMLGARADYAVAANLNLWAAFSAAWRYNRSTESWGCINLGSVISSTTGAAIAGVTNGVVDYGVVTGNNRFIPEDALGWEIYGGVDWKLLEGLRVQMDCAYWQPGDWFKWACVSALQSDGVTVSTVDQLRTGAQATINPNRSIDPILAFYLSANFEF